MVLGVTMETALAIFGGFGVGSLISQFVQHFLERKSKREEKRIEELKEAFAGLLGAMAKVIQSSNSREHQIEFALWEARVQLVGSSDVSRLIEQVKATQPYSEERGIAIDAMIRAMRRELGFAK